MQTKGAAPAFQLRAVMIPPPARLGRERESGTVTDSRPYSVRRKGRPDKRYQHGRDAIFYARGHGGEVWFTGQALVYLDYADQVLPASDKAKPPKGTCGAFCKGQTTKVVKHYVSRDAAPVRVY